MLVEYHRFLRGAVHKYGTTRRKAAIFIEHFPQKKMLVIAYHCSGFEVHTYDCVPNSNDLFRAFSSEKKLVEHHRFLRGAVHKYGTTRRKAAIFIEHFPQKKMLVTSNSF